MKRENIKNRRKEARASKLLEKYGVFGLGFIGTLLMGPQMTIVLGLLIVKSHKKLLYWTLVGIIVWSLGTIGAAGGAGIGHITSSKLLDGKKWPMVAGAAVGAVLGGVAGSKSINEDAIKSKLTKYRLSRAAVTDKARRGKYDFYVKD